MRGQGLQDDPKIATGLCKDRMRPRLRRLEVKEMASKAYKIVEDVIQMKYNAHTILH